MTLKGRVDKLERDADRRGSGRPTTVFLIPDNGRGHPGVGVYEDAHAVTVVYDANDPPPELPADVPLAAALERLAVVLGKAVAEKSKGIPG